MRNDDRSSDKKNAPPSASRPSWRGARSAASNRGAAWTAKSQAPGSRAFVHRVQLGFAILIVAALIGVVLWYAFRPDQAPRLIAIAITKYDKLVPPNGWALEDFAAMDERFSNIDRKGGTNKNLRLIRSKESDFTRDDFLKELRSRLREAQPKNPLDRMFPPQTVLIYLSVHGVAGSDDSAMLLCSGDIRGGSEGYAETDWSKSNQWLPFKDVLEIFREQEFDWLEPVRKVVILDCSRMRDNWSLGVLDNDFAGALKSAVGNAKIPGLYILNSTGIGQSGLEAPELSGTVFGHFVIRGLNGEADGHPFDGRKGKKDRRVSWKELTKYVQSHVSQWAWTNRQSVQYPLTLAPDDKNDNDFDICYVGDSVAPTISNKNWIDESRLTELDMLWTRHEKLARKIWPTRDESQDSTLMPWRVNPLDWAECEQRLVRTEQLLLAGTGYENEFNDHLRDIEKLLSKLESPRLPMDLKLSLPIARAADKLPPVSDEDRQLFEKWVSMPPPDRAPIRKRSYGELIQLGWDFVTNKKPSEKDLREVVKILGEASEPWPIDPIEIHTLKMLDRHLDRPPNSQATSFFQQPLLIRKRIEILFGPADERVHWWLEKEAERFDGSRRKAEDLLFVGDDASLKEAQRLWQQMNAANERDNSASNTNADEPASISDLMRHHRMVADALATRDEISAKLPHLVFWLTRSLRRSQNEPDLSGIAGKMFELAQKNHTLGRLLDDSLRDNALPSATVTQQGRELLDQLTAAFNDRVSKLRQVEAESAPRVRLETLDFLACPLLTGEDRTRLREKHRKDIQARREARPAADTPTPSNEIREDEARIAYEEQLLKWGEHPLIGVLDRRELPGIENRVQPDTFRFNSEVQAKDPFARRAEITRGLRLQEVAVRIQLHSVRTELGRIEQKANDSGDGPRVGRQERLLRSVTDRLVRNAAGILVKRTWDEKNLKDPSDSLQAFDRHHWFAWQTHRSLDDFWSGRGTNAPLYFYEVAGDLLREAKNVVNATVRYEEQNLDDLRELRKKAARFGIRPQPSPVVRANTAEDIAQSVTVVNDPRMPIGDAAYYVTSADTSRKTLEQWDAGQRVSRRAIPVPVLESGSRRDYSLKQEDLKAVGDHGQAEILFRGHLWSADFRVNEPGATRVVTWNAPKPRAPEVSVVGDEKQTIDVLFVLDCSNSMNDTRNGDKMFVWDDGRLKRTPNYEALLGMGKVAKRTEVAEGLRTALSKMLERRESNFRVGLIAFGHRVTIRNGKYVGDGILPNQDIELKFPVAILSNDLAFKIADFADRVEPKGFTPLYASIVKAVEAIAANGSISRVVVITDGYDTPAPGDLATAGERTTKATVASILKTNPAVHTDVILYSTDNNPQEARDELQRLDAEQSNLRVHFADSRDRLVEVVMSTVGNVKFRVDRVEGESFRKEAEVGRGTVIVDEWSDRKSPYDVTYLGQGQQPRTRIQLAGGELIQLRFNAANSRLEHISPKRAFTDYPRTEIRDREGKPQYTVSTYAPERTSEGLALFAAIENMNPTQFTPRPAVVWAEVTPQGTGAAARSGKWLLFDPDFVQRKPIPWLRFQVPFYPVESEAAGLDLYFSMKEVETERKPLADALKGKFKLASTPDVSFEVKDERRRSGDSDRYRVTVTQEYRDGSAAQPIAVWMVPAPERAEHEYSTESTPAFVRHTFEFAQDNPRAPAIVFLTRDTLLKSDSVLKAESLVIPVGKN